MIRTSLSAAATLVVVLSLATSQADEPGATTPAGSIGAVASMQLSEARGRSIALEALRHRGWVVALVTPRDGLEATLAAVASPSEALADLAARLLVVVRASTAELAPLAADVPVPLIADPDGALSSALGTERGVVVLDPDLQRRAALAAPRPSEAWAVQAVLAVARLQAGTTGADLRPAFAAFGLPVRRQGHRGTCSVFTATGALEFALAVRRGQGQLLSVEYLNWAANQVTGNRDGDGQFFHSCLSGFDRLGLCAEARMPYRRTFDHDAAPGPEAREEAAAVRAEGLRIHWIKPIGTPQGATPDELREARRVLTLGFPVAAGSYHSLLLVAFETGPDLEGGGRFLTHDSAAGGVRSMSFEEASRRLNDIFWVEAAPRPWWTEAPAR